MSGVQGCVRVDSPFIPPVPPSPFHTHLLPYVPGCPSLDVAVTRRCTRNAQSRHHVTGRLHVSAWLWPGVPGWQCGDLSLGWPAAPCPCVEAGANLQPGMPPRKKRKSATDGMSVAEQLEWGVNFYFRGGDPDRTFENGQLYVPEWLGLAEEDVLVDRVARGLKPVASIVMQPYWDMRQRAAVLHAACKRGLKLAVCHWSRLAVVYVTATPNKTMRELLRERGREGAGLKLKRGVGRKRVGWYVEHGFDMSSGPGIRVDALTSALLLGYPLDLAKQHAGLV